MRDEGREEGRPIELAFFVAFSSAVLAIGLTAHWPAVCPLRIEPMSGKGRTLPLDLGPANGRNRS